MIELIIELIRLNFEFLFFIFWVAFWLLCFLRFATEPKQPKNRLSGVSATAHSFATLRNGFAAPTILATA